MLASANSYSSPQAMRIALLKEYERLSSSNENCSQQGILIPSLLHFIEAKDVFRRGERFFAPTRCAAFPIPRRKISSRNFLTLGRERFRLAAANSSFLFTQHSL